MRPLIQSLPLVLPAHSLYSIDHRENRYARKFSRRDSVKVTLGTRFRDRHSFMNFQLKIDDDEPLQRRPLRPPPDFQSRGFRLRLMTLFAALVLVLILMQEAGKPERWEWMGFDRAAPQGDARQSDVVGENAVSAVAATAQREPLPTAWKLVTDNTAVGHVGDSEAWGDAWRLVNDAKLSVLTEAVKVQRIQLMSQPKSYRRRWVKLQGWVRSARFVDRPIAALGQSADGYQGRVGHYEFWIRPEETNAGPYCVYSLSLPAGFPEVGEEYQALNEKVEVVACFFKNRSYVSADSKPSVCPLLLAASFTRLGSRALADQNENPAPPWVPGVPAMIGIAIAFTVLAAGLAWLAKRTTQSPRYQYGNQMTEQIHEGLDQLIDDPSVITERDKVLQLQGTIDEDDVPDRSEDACD